MYAIEKNQSVPTPGKDQSLRASGFPLDKMDVGDSFAIPSAQVLKEKDSARSLRKIVLGYGYRNNKKFTTRLMPNGDLRVWRTE